MKHIKTITFITLLLVFLTACNNQETEPASTSGAFLGGTQGVIAEFEAFGVEESGTYTIFDTETFPLEVTLQNKGEHDLQPGDVTVKLLGPSQSEVTGIASWELQNQNVIDGISELVANGGEETISFSSEAEFATQITGSIERRWFANVEYDYKTFLIVPEVCLKEDITDERVCEVTGNKPFSVSGAPITITNVEESTAGKGIMALKIAVNNVGGGDVTKQGEEFGVRDSLAFSIDDPQWECKSGGRENEARLIEGRAEIICRLISPLPEGTLSTKQVSLTLDYTYRNTIQEKLLIKESAE